MSNRSRCARTTDLAGAGDGGWTADYAALADAPPIRLGEPGVHGEGRDLAIVTYGNGYYLSRQAEAELRPAILRIIDLRWLHPLNKAAIVEAVASAQNPGGRRMSPRGQPVGKALTILAEAGRGNDSSRLTADDCFIALGPGPQTDAPARHRSSMPR